MPYFLPFCIKASQSSGPYLLGTLISKLSSPVNDTLKILWEGGCRKLAILHCVTSYPTEPKDANLSRINLLKEYFNGPVGYSDHTLGTEVPIAAVALGATVIEKHFTLDRNLPGPDHRASLEPNELKFMVKSIRNIEKALSGSKIKEPSKSELKNKKIIRKSIIALKPIAKGEIFNKTNIGTKRPGTGISPINWESVIGQVSKDNFEQDELIRL